MFPVGLLLRRWKLFGLGVAIIATFWAGWEWRDRAADAAMSALQRDLADANARASEEARRAEQLAQERTSLAAEAEALRNQEREVVTRTVTQEVIKYVQTPVATSCGPDPEFVRIHDAAASGRMPGSSDTSGQPDAEADGVTNADLLSVVTDNYSRCQATRDQLLSLQEWVRAAYESEVP